MGLLTRIKKTLVGDTEDESNDDSVREPSSAVAESAAAETVDSDEVLAILRIKIAELSNGQISADGIDATAILFDFGYVDSLSAVNLIAFIDVESGVAVTELDLVGSLNHLQVLADHIERSRAGSA